VADFQFPVPTDGSPETIYTFQAAVWKPEHAQPYKSDVIQVPSRHLGWVSVAAGAQHTCAVDEEGSAQCWGTSPFTHAAVADLPSRSDSLTVSSAGNHNASRVQNGKAVAWGEDGWGQSDDRA